MRSSDGLTEGELFDRLLDGINNEFRRTGTSVRIIILKPGQTREAAVAEWEEAHHGSFQCGFSLIMDFGGGQETPFPEGGEGGSVARVPPWVCI